MRVKVVEHRSSWPSEFRTEAEVLRNTLGEVAKSIHHIGSTAVPNLAAKPIIDILIEVSALTELDRGIPRIKALGYASLGEFGIARRRFFRKGKSERTHHVHAFQESDSHVLRHIAFRDYLVAHPSVAKQYAHLKFDLVQSCRNDIDRYCDGKDEFVKEHERRAIHWFATQRGTAVDPPFASLHAGN